MTSGESDDPVVLGKEIDAILDKVTNRGSLLSFHWLIANIHNGEKPPPADESTRCIHHSSV